MLAYGNSFCSPSNPFNTSYVFHCKVSVCVGFETHQLIGAPFQDVPTRRDADGYYRIGTIVSGFGMSSGYECTGEMIVEYSFIRQPHGMLRAMPMLQRELGQRNLGQTVPHTVHTQYGHRVPSGFR